MIVRLSCTPRKFQNRSFKMKCKFDMEVEKEGAEATKEGVVPEKENGSNTADGGLVKDKKKKK